MNLVKGVLDLLLRLAVVLLSLVSGPLQTARHLLGLGLLKLCPACPALTHYTAWLDNLAAADRRAAAYLTARLPGQQDYTAHQAFPNFYNQFDGLEGV